MSKNLFTIINEIGYASKARIEKFRRERYERVKDEKVEIPTEEITKTSLTKELYRVIASIRKDSKLGGTKLQQVADLVYGILDIVGVKGEAMEKDEDKKDTKKDEDKKDTKKEDENKYTKKEENKKEQIIDTKA